MRGRDIELEISVREISVSTNYVKINDLFQPIM